MIGGLLHVAVNPIRVAKRAAIGTLRPTGQRLAKCPALELPLQFFGTFARALSLSADARIDMYGAEGDRTPDLCSAIAALSQLSYSPGMPDERHLIDDGRTPA